MAQADADDLALFARRQRRRRAWYAPVVAVIVCAAVAFFVVEIREGEISHQRLRVAASTPRPVLAQALADTLTRAWRSDDDAATGMPFYAGTVVTYSAHVVTGRDALTGAARWSFTRSDRTICDVAQTHGRVIALYEVKGDCAEATALSTDTGARVWDRTLFSDGRLVAGHPRVVVGEDTVAFATDSVVWAVTSEDGGDRWIYSAPAGCRNTGAAWGSAGMLITQTCQDGPHTLLRQPYAPDPNEGDTSTASPVKWRVRSPDAQTPLLADGAILTSDATGLTRYAPADGKTLPVAPLPGGSTTVTQASQQAGLLLAADGGGVFSLSADAATVLWHSSQVSVRAPDIDDSGDAASPAPTLIAAVIGAVLTLNPASGATLKRYPMTESSPSSRVFRVGAGVLLANSAAASDTFAAGTTAAGTTASGTTPAVARGTVLYQ